MKLRGVPSFSMISKLYRRPVDNIFLNVELFRKTNGYRSFLLNQSLDFCYYMRNPKAYVFFHSFHNSFVAVSNFNHTCPYNHDIIIKGWSYKKGSMIELPMPNGDYMIYLKLSVSKVWRAEIKLYVTRTD
ncbi:uncharacterized protein LOC6557456 [Drosophila grimshawi]|uniref:GH15144 n=1 Tax=Drosophila grimshawi TaxID=7222 RepID=B4IY81_DROGR|nr:uncharacterized protein LOC6557456 [Drosophila grimshawi]EDV96531.1 GH15144 [Drosophila grimshawi]